MTELSGVSTQPIFRSVFASSWDDLPPVMRKHYANRPFCNDHVTVAGIMHIKIHWLVRMLAPVFAISNTLVPKAGTGIDVTVKFVSEPNSEMFCLDRIFSFPGGKTYRFFSRMEPVGGNEVVEWTASGIGWRAAYAFQNDHVTLQHRGYCFRLFGKRFALPVTALFGSANAEEKAISGNRFEMKMSIVHPLLGELYSYGGVFEISDMVFDE